MLFGHQGDSNQPGVQTPSVAQDSNPGVNPLAVDPATGASLPVVQADSAAPSEVIHPDDAQDEQSVLNQPVDVTSSPISDSALASTPDPSAPFGPAPVAVDDPAPLVDEPTDVATTAAHIAAELDNVTPQVDAQPAPVHSDFAAPLSMSTATVDSGTLLDLKQQAISQLSPLVSHLEQSPEEKFRTTMMLIQSTDNSALLPDAYNAAQAIQDEKARAQALLDVVNEINYFTQQHAS
jgi:hypothetical protein